MVSGNSLITNRTAGATQIARALRESGAIWLDSVFGFGDRGRRSYIARRPVLDISISGATAIVRGSGAVARTLTGVDGLALLQRLWSKEAWFSVGYISYEAALEYVAPEVKRFDLPVPSVRFAFYDSVLQIDHLAGTLAATDPEKDDYADVVDDCGEGRELAATGIGDARIIGAVPRSRYYEDVEGIKYHIHEGDIYQANYTTRIDVVSDTEPLSVYLRLRDLSPGPYGAYLNYGDYQILSSSPERMFLKEGNRVTTGPIKGTIGRGRDEEEDERNLVTLLGSQKDRAELLMIVDLARNDLGRVAEVGSVRVDSLFRPEKYASVIHLVGDVSARVNSDCGVGDVIRALLPGGSITGAPKKRAVEIISSVEPKPRGVYTGCIGYVHGDRADFNIAIRTMVHRHGCYQVHAGGGIVADSTAEQEYEEMRLKASGMLAAVGIQKEKVACPG